MGGRLKLEYMIEGIPTSNITWNKDNIILSSNDRLTGSFTMEGLSTVIIESTKLEDSGIYRCTASNIAGFVSTTVAGRVKNDGELKTIHSILSLA